MNNYIAQFVHKLSRNDVGHHMVTIYRLPAALTQKKNKKNKNKRVSEQ